MLVELKRDRDSVAGEYPMDEMELRSFAVLVKTPSYSISKPGDFVHCLAEKEVWCFLNAGTSVSDVATAVKYIVRDLADNERIEIRKG